MLLSPHLIDAADEICDRIAILEKRRVVVAGPTDAAKQGIAGTLGRGSLEELYASVVEDSAAVDLPWMTG